MVEAGAAAPEADPLGPVPDDLVVDVTVLPGRRVSEDLVSSGAVHARRARYILFPDGSLHAAVGREEWVGYGLMGTQWTQRAIGVLSRPAQTRVVSRETMADVWLLARQCGLSDPAASTFDGNPALLSPKPDEILTIISICVGGRQGTFLERRPATPVAGDPADAAPDVTSAGRFVRGLAQLAWASDDLPAETAVLPLRYDLGPNPYARYLPPRVMPVRRDDGVSP